MINPNKPLFLLGYNRGVQYYEFNAKYNGFNKDYKNKYVMSVFISLIVVLDKVNDNINVFDYRIHIY